MADFLSDKTKALVLGQFTTDNPKRRKILSPSQIAKQTGLNHLKHPLLPSYLNKLVRQGILYRLGQGGVPNANCYEQSYSVKADGRKFAKMLNELTAKLRM